MSRRLDGGSNNAAGCKITRAWTEAPAHMVRGLSSRCAGVVSGLAAGGGRCRGGVSGAWASSGCCSCSYPGAGCLVTFGPSSGRSLTSGAAGVYGLPEAGVASAWFCGGPELGDEVERNRRRTRKSTRDQLARRRHQHCRLRLSGMSVETNLRHSHHHGPHLPLTGVTTGGLPSGLESPHDQAGCRPFLPQTTDASIGSRPAPEAERAG